VRSLFRTLLGLGTTVMVFGILFAQTKSTDHTPDLIIWSLAITLLVAALVVGWLRKSKIGAFPEAWFVAIGFELLLCGYAIVDVLKHLHSL
jgi:hypothetical protein